ncbi:MAG: hypothetical protein ACC634_02715 [Hyphomicrobiales bacterium]
MTDLKQMDPRGLFTDSYLIEGITEGECRSIFLDWALGVPVGQEPRDWVALLLKQFQPAHPAHPMTKVLSQAMAAAPAGKRRGGRGGRINTA